MLWCMVMSLARRMFCQAGASLILMVEGEDTVSNYGGYF